MQTIRSFLPCRYSRVELLKSSPWANLRSDPVIVCGDRMKTFRRSGSGVNDSRVLRKHKLGSGTSTGSRNSYFDEEVWLSRSNFAKKGFFLASVKQLYFVLS